MKNKGMKNEGMKNEGVKNEGMKNEGVKNEEWRSEEWSAIKGQDSDANEWTALTDVVGGSEQLANLLTGDDDARYLQVAQLDVAIGKGAHQQNILQLANWKQRRE